MVKSVPITWLVSSSEMMIGQVQKRVEELAERLNRLQSKTSERSARIGATPVHARNQLNGELSQLGQELEKDRPEDVEVNANGLPLIEAAILLTGVPDGLAEPPNGLGWVSRPMRSC